MTATSLENLHDIVVPPPPPWLPPAPGWYALGFGLLLLAAWGAWAWWRHRRRNRYRRQALAELDRLERELRQLPPPLPPLRRLPELLKRAALVAYGREQVAALSGAAWLSFLDGTVARPVFGPARGALLLRCDYAPPGELAALEPGELEGLLKAVRAWLTDHRLPDGE